MQPTTLHASPPRRRWQHLTALGLGAVVGALAGAGALRPDFIAGTSPYWGNPRGDVKMQLTGYFHFVREPWGWPLGITHSVNPPSGYNVAFADTTPVIALLAKFVRPVVPRFLEATFLHPFGLWLLAMYVLQGIFAVRLAWSVDVRSRVGVVCAAALACTLPTFVIRSGHTSLMAHFVLLWAILLVVRARRAPPTRACALEWTALMGFVALVHAYLLAMCAALFVGWVFVSLRWREARWTTVATVVGATTTVLGSLAAFGQLHEKLHWAPYFGEASFNPLALVLTRFATINPLARLVDPIRADATGFQYEGYDYLGLGLLGLIGVALIRQRARWIRSLKDHAVLLCVLVALVLFAASNRIYVGPKLIVAFDVPESLRTLVSQLRSSGRLIWAPTYALLFFVVQRIARMGKTGEAILIAATAIQIVDVVPHFGWFRDFTGAPDEVLIDEATWAHPLSHHDRVWSYPSFECAWMLRGAWEDANYKTLYQLGFRSALLGKTVNSIHNARAGRDCLDDVHERETLVPRPDTLYVFLRRAATGQMLTNLENRGAKCLPFERGFACSSSFDDEDVRAFARSASLSSYTPDTWIAFGEGGTSASYEGGGWGPQTPEGAYVGWPIEGSRSTVHFARPTVPIGTVELDVDAEAGPLAPTHVLGESAGMTLGEIELAPGARTRISYDVNRCFDGGKAWCALDLREAPAPVGAASRARLRVRRVRMTRGSPTLGGPLINASAEIGRE